MNWETILSSIKAIEDLVTGVYAHTSLRRNPLHAERDAVTAAAINLNIAWYTVQSELRDGIRPANEESSFVIPLHLHHQYLFVTSLIQANDHIWGTLA